MKQQTVARSSSYRLITIPISHYCEKARWALDWLQIPYVEERHVPFFHRLATRRHSAKSVPVLVTEDGALVDSTDILRYLDGKITGSHRLYPIDPTLRLEVDKLEELFDTQLGSYTPCWAYFYWISDRAAMRRGWCEGTPKIEQITFEIAFPLMQRIVQRTLNVTENSATRALQGIWQIFDRVSHRLSDGRRYLVGDNFSAADLTFAALSAPILLPAEHPMKLPKIDETNSEMATTIKELRATSAGIYALSLYQKHRYST